MAHSCRWRFPARPGGSTSANSGRRAARIRVTASLRTGTGAQANPNGLWPGFDAALQVSATIGNNLRKFRDVFGEASSSSSGEEDAFVGFSSQHENRRIYSSTRPFGVKPRQERKPRGRPPRALTAHGTTSALDSPTSPASPPEAPEKQKRAPGRPPASGERKRGRPPGTGGPRGSQYHHTQPGPQDQRETTQEQQGNERDKKAAVKRTPLGCVQQQYGVGRIPKIARIPKIKRLSAVKLAPLKSRLKVIGRKGAPVPAVPRRRRGRPPSAERLKAEAAAASQPAALYETEPRKQKIHQVRRERDPQLRAAELEALQPHSLATSPTRTGLGKEVGVRQSPRKVKQVRIVPAPKRTDTTIAKQLLQRAKKGAQKGAQKKKMMEKEAGGGSVVGSGLEGGIRRKRTQLKFVMPVVSTISSRIIKTPKRFIEDEASFVSPPPHLKVARLEAAAVASSSLASPPSAPPVAAAPSVSVCAASASTPQPQPPPPPAPAHSTNLAGLNSGCNNGTSNGRFSSSAASCGSSEKSSAVSQHSSQLSSGESSRSSSPSLDTSTDSQASEGTQGLSEEPDRSPSSQGEREAELLHASRPSSPPSEPEQVAVVERGRRGRRFQGAGRGRAGVNSGGAKKIIAGATLLSSHPASSTASSSSSPPPLLTPPPQSSQPASSTEHHSPHPHWILPPGISPFLPASAVVSPLQEQRKSILREPTFRWTSLKHSRAEAQCFSSAKYAKEGLIRKPIFDNFRPPPLTPEDVGLVPPNAGGAVAGFSTPSGGGTAAAANRLFSPLHHQPHHPSSHFETQPHKRSPLLRAPRFTPSEAHSRIFESVTLPSPQSSTTGGQASSSSPLQSSALSSSSSSASRTQRRRRRRSFIPLRLQPRSPSHSMRTRSSRSGEQGGNVTPELSPVAPHLSTGATGSTTHSNSLPGVAASPLAASALTPATFSFSPGSMGLTSKGPADSYQTGSSRRQAGGLGKGAAAGESFSSGVGVGGSSSTSPLFPLFTSSPPQSTERGGTGKSSKERRSSGSRELSAKEKDSPRETERARDREKENKLGSRKERERKGRGSVGGDSQGALFSLEGKESEEMGASPSPVSKKTSGRKKSVSVEPPTEAPSSLGSPEGGVPKSRLSKKGKSSEKGQDSETGEKEKEKSHQQTLSVARQSPQPPAPSHKQPPAPSLGSMLAQVEKQQVADRRVANLLKKAKAQLYKIEKSKSLKTSDQPKTQGQESDSSEASVRGPRIKHVCRRAAVALGRNRAVFPDDMPTLSALPWEEREKILSSMGNDDKSSVAGSEEAETPAPPVKPIKPVTRHKTPQEPPVKKGRRSRRCGQCPGCQVPDDCGVCTNCLDKPKFGGRNIKKQCCKVRKCQNLQWMPSKAYLQKQAKAAKKEKKKTTKVQEKKETAHSAKSHSSETNQKLATPSGGSAREEPARKKSETPPSKPSAEKQQHSPQWDRPPPPSTALPQDPKQPTAPPTAASRKERKQPLLHTPSPAHPNGAPQQQTQSPGPSKKEGAILTPPSEPKKKLQQASASTPATETGSEPKQQQQKKQAPRSTVPPKQKPKEKEKLLPSRAESSTLNLLSTPSNGGNTRQKLPSDGVHRIRVDFKEDCDVENVWEMGGLSILTSVPITPRVVCLLCASSGHVEFVYCQVCCEPFHLFCLEESERPLEEQWENWCCRRCKFCHVCGRLHQATKQLLECNKCRNSYHPECLGPNYPTRPTKKKKVWICTKCVHCKSCGATTPGKSWDAQWSHDFSLCHDCAKLFAKGNFCPLCDKCYDDDDYESKMMQCGKCDRWVHSKCENLTDEMYEILSNLPENIAYTCINCTDQHPAEWRTALGKELQGSVRLVLTALLNSRTTTHLLRYRQAVKPPELNPETEESIPSRSSPEGPDPPVLTEVSPQHEAPLDLEGVKRKMEQGGYTSVLEFSDDIVKIIQAAMNTDGGQPENKKANSMVKSFFIRQMERVFPWFNVKESRFWEPNKVSTNSGLLPNAVLPPSLDHNYAQWQEREDINRAEQPPLMKKIIPAPRAKGPGDPDSPTPPPPPPAPAPLPTHGSDHNREDSPELIPPPDVGDNRQCVLCLKYGDDSTNDGGRLLYAGQNEWTHVNCALWSAEVFEDDDGSLKNVHMAVIRGKQLRCEHCQRPGATVGCCLTSCTSNYHFMCARLKHCVFLEDKKVYCQRHRDLVKGEVVSDSGFEVTRRIFVDFEGISLRRKFLAGLEPENIHMMIGSMTIDCLGILTDLSDCERKLFPVGYQCSRVYWSTQDARKRCIYTCRIVVCRPPQVESDINSTLEHEDNKTIAHSMAAITDMLSSPVSVEPPAVLSKESLPPPRLQSATRNRHPSYSPTSRSPGSGSRPLPSAGSPSPMTHEIVTVGDTLLSSGLRRIGSRRHSTSSLSPQPPKQRITSPSRGGRPTGPTPSPTRKESGEPETGTGSSSSVRIRECQPGPLSPGGGVRKNQNNPRQQRLGSSEERVNKEQGEPTTKGAAVVSVAAVRLSQTSPPLGTAVLSSQGRGTNSSSSKSEKGKTASARDPALSPGHGLASRLPSATLPKDGSGERAKNMNSTSTAVPALKEALAAGSRQPPHHKGGKKSWEQLAGGPAEKPLRDTTQPEDTAKRGSQPATSTATGHGTHTAKEKRSKMKAREAAKDKEKLPPNSNTQASASTANSVCGNGKTSGSGTNSDAVRIDAVVFENQVADKHVESGDRLPSMEKKVTTPSPTNEGSQSKTSTDKAFKGSQPQNETPGKEAQPAQRKRTVKVTLTPLKMDPDVTKTISTSSSFPPAAPQKTPACTLPFSSPSVSPQSSESEVLGHQDEGASEIHDHQGGMEDVAYGKEGSGDAVEHSLQDGSGGDKHQEEDSDGSVKRRYPRRSARARSNMFFGLTPFYGVRSYGEEDIPFYSSGDSSSGKKRGGGGGSKRSAEGQVDGADDMTTSSSEETGDEEEGAGRGSDEGDYYYNFTRTVINPGAGMTPSGVIEQCLGRVAPLRSFLKEESEEEEMIGERELGLARIGQLDGVDDGSESDGSVSATTTTTASASKSAQSGGKRKGKERRSEKLDLEEETGKEQTGSGGSSSENNKSQKDSSKMENCLPLGSVKAQGQDSLEAQLSLNAELLKSDSDNTNSDDCGNILPSDIMDFVLNTPSMQALGQRPESSSSELMSLEEGFGLGGNRGKEMGLFEDFSQQLTNSEPVESGVSASIPGEEQFELPLELPSDLSVLTTRSPAVASQNHSSLIPEQAERSILVLPSEDSVEKGTDKQHAPNKGQLGGQDETQVAEGHMTPEQFIQGMETDHMTNPVCGQGVEQGSQDLARTSVTPGLQVPASPTVSLQGPKYIPSTAESPGPTQVASTAVQTTATHLKQPTEKLIVVNQHMQPLYVLQTLPNGVTSVSTAAGVMDTSSSVLGSMAGGLALAAGLNPGIPTSQSIFSPTGKGLPMTHHSQLHAFSGTGQAGFQSGIPSSTSGLLIGVQPSQDPQILVSEAGHRTELAPNSTPPSSSTSSSLTSSPSGHGKKRQISRLQPRKPKKLARSGSQPTLAPSEAVPNMTLINFSPSQLSTGIPNQPTTTSATPHRTVPNIIKRPKSGGMYFEQAPLLQQGICTLGAPAGMIGPDASSHLVPCTVSGLNTNQSVLNVMSIGQSSVSLASPGRLCPADLTGSISNLLLKASQQSLGLSDQQMALQSGAGIFSQLGSPMPTSNTGSICVLPSTQPIGMPVFQPADQEGPYQLHHHQITQLLASNPSPLDPVNTKTSMHGALGSVAQDSARTRPVFTSAQSSNVGPAPVRSDQQPAAQVTTAPPSTTAISGKGKTKSKRTQHLPDKGSGKKHKVCHSESAGEKQPSADAGSGSTTPARSGPQGPASQEVMEIDQKNERERGTGPVPSMTEGPAALTTNSTDRREEKSKVKDLQTPEMEGTGGFSSPLLALLEQERRRKESLSDRKSRKGLMFEICSDDGFQICSESIEDAWRSLTDKVQEARSNARLKQLSFEGVNGLRMLGVIHDAVVFLIEQLYGAKHCRNYKFRFHKPEEADEPPLNPHGSARAEVHHRRSVFDMFNFLASKHRQPPEYNPNDEEEEEVQLKSARRATSMDLPMPMRFRHLKKTSKEAVGVYRSAIHGRGLFCKRNIDAGEMVIEYSGNVIRSVLTDKREKYYDGKGIGCYMFRIDDYEVVDATMHGNAARFINHACEPNCYSRVINIDGQKHIVIFATRKIYRGEELTYDYKFPIEDASSKLHCNCGAKKCRKFIN
ncbi:histone-lysine N-methyltransferase 2A-like isoform X1 [Acipenser ruthenus]|uniref:histone-lysine N-methyltransferase 2A-like isoform X1 n=1 Tax=Acipenser ruthenus TaxID=7906 RepID=UPI002741E13E|nr:histone-lysine N-methyltransferase 2A-like isoform X1 [Acipenser ruthenus]